MPVEVIQHSVTEVTLQLTVNLQGGLLEVEERIQSVLNEAGCEVTALAIGGFDTDGSPIMTGDIKWTRRCRSPKTYQTPYGAVEVERDVYQTSRGGKTYVPLEAAARIIRSSTPLFAKQVTNKYARMNAAEVCADLWDNHGRQVSRGTLQLLADSVGGMAQLKEESWQYESPRLDCAVKTVVCSLDGADLLEANDGWREAMVGTLSLYDVEGERQHTVYIGAAPEYGKGTFFQRYQQELSHLKALYPDALYLGIADGSSSNWAFLEQHTERQLLDYFHASEYLAGAAHAAYPQKTGKPQRQQWLTERCHPLKHEEGAAQAILTECQGFRNKRKLSRTVREDLEATITYFENQGGRMGYAAHTRDHLPIGSGVTEAACKTLVKQRFCGAGMRWKDAGIKAVMSLRALVLTPGRWAQFWGKVQQYGVPSLA
ncbi:MAG: ISKra4 family transposase [Thiolinea sp.]